MRHDEVACQLKAFLDGELDLAFETDVREHLIECEQCRADLDELTELSWRIGQLPEGECPTGLRERVLERVLPRRRPVFRWSLAAAGALGLVALTFIVLQGHRLAPQHLGPVAVNYPRVLRPAPPATSAPQGPIVWHEVIVTIHVSSLPVAWKTTRSVAYDMAGEVFPYERTAADVREGRQLSVLVVPLPRLKDTISALGKLGRVTYRHNAERDVTDEVADTNRLIARWHAYEEQVVRGMADAKTVPQLIEMDHAVANARERIATLQTRVNMLLRFSGSGMITIYIVGPSGQNVPLSCVTPPRSTVA